MTLPMRVNSLFIRKTQIKLQYYMRLPMRVNTVNMTRSKTTEGQTSRQVQGIV